MKHFLVILFFSFIINSCKKESLTNYPELVGEWECKGVSQGSGFVYANEFGFRHTLIFKNNGVYKIIKQDGGKDEKGRVVSIDEHTIELKNSFQSKKYLKGIYGYSSDTIPSTGEIRLFLGGTVSGQGGYIHFNNVTYGYPRYTKIK